jgi:hypothetical protein
MSSASSAIDQILNFEKSDAEDYYKILGCDESSSVSFENISNCVYRVKAPGIECARELIRAFTGVPTDRANQRRVQSQGAAAAP